jgi:lipopolysaccharide transport system ATP-binding protein
VAVSFAASNTALGVHKAMTTVISVESLSKAYRLGQIGTGTFTYDLQLWWAKLRGKPNPLRRIGATDHGNRDGETLWALKDVSFTVEQGEVLGIIGRNGAGKSTLLKILSRVTAPTSGRIKVKGRVASLLEVGTGFHPELTGRENIYLNGALLGMSRKEIDRKLDEIVDFAEVEKFIDTPVKRYSSGMYVRLAFAVAAHLEPEILVVDEVLAVGDAEFQKKCLGKIGDVAHKGRTVLFVSHNMAAIEAICRRTLLVKAGGIQADGPTSEVVGTYIADSKRDKSPSPLDVSSDGRQGSGQIRFVRWAVIDDALGTGRLVRAGQSCTFEIEYTTSNNQGAANVEVTLTIDDIYGKPILTASTAFLNASFEMIPAHGKFLCHFSSLPLLPNRYQVHLWCGTNGDTADKLPNAGYFEVVVHDIYGSGRLPRSKHGVIAVREFHWHLSEKPVDTAEVDVIEFPFQSG